MTSSVERHSFNPHRAAVTAIAKAITRLDTELRSLARRPDLYDGERAQLTAKAKQRADAEIGAAKRDLTNALADSKKLAGSYTPELPDDVAAARHWREIAAADLAGLTPDQVLAVTQAAAAGDNPVRAQAFIQAARPVLLNHPEWGPAHRRLEVAAEPREAKVHRAFGEAVGAVEERLAWLDRGIVQALDSAGRVPTAVQDGLAPEQPVDTRAITLWGSNLEGHATAAFSAAMDAQDAAADRGADSQ